ncbi:hypothetical protein V5799_007670 [Amblyomma americanum]|uniref:Uncharacterized protein n=1 Tax=Amblyomma americanum TaxID=6943 RepID=A0AAQ4FGP1_AMBAM
MSRARDSRHCEQDFVFMAAALTAAPLEAAPYGYRREFSNRNWTWLIVTDSLAFLELAWHNSSSEFEARSRGLGDDRGGTPTVLHESVNLSLLDKYA